MHTRTHNTCVCLATYCMINNATITGNKRKKELVHYLLSCFLYLLLLILSKASLCRIPAGIQVKHIEYICKIMSINCCPVFNQWEGRCHCKSFDGVTPRGYRRRWKASSHNVVQANITRSRTGLEVCGSTRTRGYTRPDPYPRVRVGSGTGTTSTGTGIPGFSFTRK